MILKFSNLSGGHLENASLLMTLTFDIKNLNSNGFDRTKPSFWGITCPIVTLMIFSNIFMWCAMAAILNSTIHAYSGKFFSAPWLFKTSMVMSSLVPKFNILPPCEVSWHFWAPLVISCRTIHILCISNFYNHEGSI